MRAHKTLFVYCGESDRAGDRTVPACVQFYRVVDDARSNRRTMINRERDPLGSVGGDLSCLVDGQRRVGRRGNWRKKESSFLSFLAFPLSCLARLACLVLAWLRFGEREGAGGQGLWVHCACYGCYAMQSTDGWAVVYRMVAGVACCSDTFLVGSRQAHTHTFSHTQRNGGHAGTVGGGGGG